MAPVRVRDRSFGSASGGIARLRFRLWLSARAHANIALPNIFDANRRKSNTVTALSIFRSGRFRSRNTRHSSITGESRPIAESRLQYVCGSYSRITRLMFSTSHAVRCSARTVAAHAFRCMPGSIMSGVMIVADLVGGHGCDDKNGPRARLRTDVARDAQLRPRREIATEFVRARLSRRNAHLGRCLTEKSVGNSWPEIALPPFPIKACCRDRAEPAFAAAANVAAYEAPWSGDSERNSGNRYPTEGLAPNAIRFACRARHCLG